MYPYINIALERITKKEHFTISLLSFVLYFVIIFITQTKSLYITDLLVFIIIYLIVAYIKKYKMLFCDNVKQNIILFVFTAAIFYLMIFYNFAISELNMKWHVLNNPFFLIMAICLLNLFRKLKISNILINTISGISIYIYLIHDNVLFREHLRYDLVSIFIYHFGIEAMPIKMIFFALLLFIASSIFSYLYVLLFDKIIDNVSKKIVCYINKFIDLLI